MVKVSDKELDRVIKDIESTQITIFNFCRETILPILCELKELRANVSKYEKALRLTAGEINPRKPCNTCIHKGEPCDVNSPSIPIGPVYCVPGTVAFYKQKVGL